MSVKANLNCDFVRMIETSHSYFIAGTVHLNLREILDLQLLKKCKKVKDLY